jgi:chromosome segregation ATPase
MITVEDKNTENVQEISKDGNKVRSIRADSDTYEKFKKLSEEFDGQGRCLAELIHMYEINQARNVLIERQVEIDDFQTHIEKLRETYLYSLRLNADAEDRIREAFKAQLNSKDETILSLQETNKKLNADLEIKSSLLSNTLSENREHTSKNSKLEKEIERTSEEYNKKIKEKDDFNSILMSERQGKESKIQEMAGEIDTLKGELVNLEVLREEKTTLEKSLEEKNGEIRKKMLEYEEKILELKKENQEELKKANEEHQKQVKEDREAYRKEIEIKNAEIKDIKSERDEYKKMFDKISKEIMEIKSKALDAKND